MLKAALDKVKNLLNKWVAIWSQAVSHVAPTQSAAVVPAQIQAQAYLN